MSVNLDGTFFMCRATLPHLLDGGPLIELFSNVNPGSPEHRKAFTNTLLEVFVAGLLTPAGATTHREVYIRNLRYAAREMAKHGLTVVIEPINTRTVPGFFLSGSAQAAAILDEEGGDPSLTRELRQAAEELLKERGEEIQAGYNVSAIAAEAVNANAIASRRFFIASSSNAVSQW